MATSILDIIIIIEMIQSSKWKFKFTGPNQILEVIFYIVLNKNWKIYRSEQTFT
jgi:hypothetical protein